jgi:hypothetical protein
VYAYDSANVARLAKSGHLLSKKEKLAADCVLVGPLVKIDAFKKLEDEIMH